MSAKVGNYVSVKLESVSVKVRSYVSVKLESMCQLK
jgi:hypothetical protein